MSGRRVGGGGANLFIKNCVLILTCGNFSQLQSPLHLMQYAHREVFSHCSKQRLKLSILMPFSASAVFVSPLPCGQNVFL